MLHAHRRARRAFARVCSGALVVAGTATIATVVTTPAAQAAGQSISTTTNVGAPTGNGHCLNPNTTSDPTNCNAYASKADVWLSNLPQGLPEGDYFFAVSDPGSQSDPNDGSDGLLSAGTHTDRSFRIENGHVTILGDHLKFADRVQVFPFADTTNGGGVYNLSVCSLAGGYPVVSSDCTHDSFKVGAAPVEAKPLTIVKDAAGTYDRTYTWDIDKAVDDDTLEGREGTSVTANYTVTVEHDGGEVDNIGVTGDITVFNPNGAAVTADVTDVLSDGTVCTVDGGTDAVIPAMGDTVLGYTCDLTSLPQGQLDNTATVTWEEQTLGNTDHLAAGDESFTYDDVTFTGNDIDECIDVDDTVEGTLGTVCVGDDNPTELSYDRTWNLDTPGCQDYDNTASFETNDTGSTDDASQSVEVCTIDVLDALTVSKEAEGDYTTTYKWSVDKSVDDATLSGTSGDVTAHYTVKVSHDAGTITGTEVHGTITVTNPNSVAVVADIADTFSDGAVTCEVDGDGTGVTVQPGDTELSYTCDLPDGSVPASDLTNTVDVTWADQDPAPLTVLDAGNATDTTDAIDFTENAVDECADVTDTYAGDLGQVCVGDANPTTFDYSRTWTLSNPGCATYGNTATATAVDSGTKSSDSQDVQVCKTTVDTGAHTIGFWTNNNGQALIKAGPSTGGVCNAATTLRTYNPFKDLSATATCTQLAKYVADVISKAKASDMTTMLKAQMLGTALSVIHLNPALANLNVDLAHMDGKDVRASFGGASSMTVGNALTFVSNKLVGSSWYGGSKVLQEGAKNLFDAINNSRGIYTP